MKNKDICFWAGIFLWLSTIIQIYINTALTHAIVISFFISGTALICTAFILEELEKLKINNNE